MEKQKKKCVIFDLDGTLCNIDHRLHFIEDEKKDYDAFYAACDKDSLNVSIGLWMTEIFFHSGHSEYEGPRVFIVSGRRWTCQFATAEWLNDHSIPYDKLFMPRGTHDYRPDTEIKEEILEEIQQEYEVFFAVDDRPSVIEMWRKHGIKVYPVFQERWGK
jgi:hypothetical protein